MTDQNPTTPTPQTAYAHAPSIISELNWLAREMSAHLTGEPMPREYWLRKAAVLDRIALDEADTYGPASAAEAALTATLAACQLADLDHRSGDGDTDSTPDTGPGPSPRRYVRQAYLTWRTT
jgi:hypothetical protein